MTESSYIHIASASIVVAGVTVGKVEDVRVPISLVAGGGVRGGVVEVEGKETSKETATSEQQQTLLSPTEKAEGKRGRVDSAVIDRVWLHYAETMKPRRKEATEEDRRLIAAALKVADEAELIAAITGCEKSDYHMKRGQYAHRNGGKYNRLSQIVKGRRAKETTRERIDFFLDRAEQAARGEKEVPSVQDAIVQQRVADVRRGYHQPDDEEMVEQAMEAESWLQERGIETQRNADGYPTFRRTGVVKGANGK